MDEAIPVLRVVEGGPRGVLVDDSDIGMSWSLVA